MSTKPEVDRAITQLALFMQARDAKQFGATVDGRLTPSWDDVGPAAQEEYLRDAGAILVAVVTLGYAPPGALEAAEAELTRRDTVIANAIEVADELFDIADVNYGEDNYDAGQVRAAAEIKTVLVAAPVSLEAPTLEQFEQQVFTERERQEAKGYTVEHDREHGVDHLLVWAIEYARKGEPVKSAALILAARELIGAPSLEAVKAADVPVDTVIRSAMGTIACRVDALHGVVFGEDRPFLWSALADPIEVLWRPVSTEGDNRG